MSTSTAIFCQMSAVLQDFSKNTPVKQGHKNVFRATAKVLKMPKFSPVRKINPQVCFFTSPQELQWVWTTVKDCCPLTCTFAKIRLVSHHTNRVRGHRLYIKNIYKQTQVQHISDMTLCPCTWQPGTSLQSELLNSWQKPGIFWPP